MTKKEALSIVFACAPLYKENLVDKSLLFITTDKHKSVHAGLAAVHIAALAQFGASCRVQDRKSTRLNSSHSRKSRMPSSA